MRAKLDVSEIDIIHNLTRIPGEYHKQKFWDFMITAKLRIWGPSLEAPPASTYALSLKYSYL